MITEIQMVSRIGIAAVLGGIIGLERDIHGRTAGLRTHLLVSMTAATFMVVSSQFAYFQNYSAGDLIEVDGSRIAASVVTAISFLAGGAILRTGITIQGLTTGAGLWLVTSIGLSAGAGMYLVSVFVTCMGLIALTVLRILKKKDERMLRRRFVIRLSDRPNLLMELRDQLEELGIRIIGMDVEKKFEQNEIHMSLELRIPTLIGVDEVIAIVEQQPGLLEMRVRMPE